MSDDHSKVVPLLPIPNRTVKRFCANDSAGSRVKVGHRQTLIASKCPTQLIPSGAFVFFVRKSCGASAKVPSLFVCCNQLKPELPAVLPGHGPIALRMFPDRCQTCCRSRQFLAL